MGTMTAKEFFKQYGGKKVKYTGGSYSNAGLYKGGSHLVVGYIEGNDMEILVEDSSCQYGATLTSHQLYFTRKLIHIPTVHPDLCFAWRAPVYNFICNEYDWLVGKRVITPLGNGKVEKVDDGDVVCVELEHETGLLYEFQPSEVKHLP